INYDSEKELQSDVGLESSSSIRLRFEECNGSLPGVRQEFVEGDRETRWEHTGSSSKDDQETRQKFTEDTGKIVGS
ncbi:hypothetical protein B296_00012283, partial [Ensete ventricosum]